MYKLILNKKNYIALADPGMGGLIGAPPLHSHGNSKPCHGATVFLDMVVAWCVQFTSICWKQYMGKGATTKRHSSHAYLRTVNGKGNS